jgi:DNA-binding NarL/FixJ family response regulator
MKPILLVDDHPIIAEACRIILADDEEIVVAHDLASGYQALLEHRPGVVILDLSFPGHSMAGMDLLRRISADAPLARVLIFSMHAEANIVASVIKAGASGYLLKDSPPDELQEAVRQVRLGKFYIDKRIELRGSPVSDPFDAADGRLKPREMQALSLLGGGKSYPAIAEEMEILPRAVARLLKSARTKLGIHRTSDLLRRARELASAKPDAN